MNTIICCFIAVKGFFHSFFAFAQFGSISTFLLFQSDSLWLVFDNDVCLIMMLSNGINVVECCEKNCELILFVAP